MKIIPSFPFSQSSMQTTQSLYQPSKQRITTPNWNIPTLDSFIQSLTSENDNLIQMGIIRSSKDQALVARGDKVVNDKGKQRDESLVKKEHSKEPSILKIRNKNGKRQGPILLLSKGFSFRKLLYEKTT